MNARHSLGVLIPIVATLSLWGGCAAPPPDEEQENLGTVQQPVAWTYTASMASARAHHAAAALASGKVMVCGGRSAFSTYLDTCAIYRPDDNDWIAGPTLDTERLFPTLTALTSTSVLIAGGTDGSPLATAYTGSESAWSTTAETIVARIQSVDVLLSNGTVLLVGGTDGSTALGSQRRVGSSWSSAGTLVRRAHAATVLASGTQALVVGGVNASNTELATASVYAAGSNSWSASGSLNDGVRQLHTATLMDDGSVLVAGGSGGGNYHSTAERWVSGTFQGAGSLTERVEHAAIAVGQFVIVAGGSNSVSSALDSVEVYNRVTNDWTALEPLQTGRRAFTMTPTADGDLLVVGGVGTGYLNSAERLHLRQLGETCTAGTADECISGRCTNAVCCLYAACNTGYVCTAGTGDCPTSCSSDAQCTSTYYCDGGSCVAKKAKGGACDAQNECGAGLTCRDGVCCDGSCSGQCERCDSGGNCVPTNGAPVGGRPACGGVGAGTECGRVCNGTNRTSCVYPTSACGADSCSGGVETHVSTCLTGSCQDVPTGCGAYACGASACLSSCDDNAHCASGYICESDTCVPIPGKGEPCGGGDECNDGLFCHDNFCCGVDGCAEGASCGITGLEGDCYTLPGEACELGPDCGSGYCVDGVCCSSECDQQCARCNAAGSEGTCTARQGAPLAPRAACDGVAEADTGCAPRCDGENLDACEYPAAGNACGADSCEVVDGQTVETRVGECDGSGTCDDERGTCGEYACDGDSSCHTDCEENDDCAPGFFCDDSSCSPVEGLGAACADDGNCNDGLYCVDSVCCGVESCATGFACDLSGHEGECLKDNGQECEFDDQCGSGNCVDGYCCTSACDRQCEACDVEGEEGTCTGVSGDPHGDRDACNDDSVEADDCALLTCDGASDRSACVSYVNGNETECAPASCDGSEFTNASVCNGRGGCRQPEVTSCVPYVCNTSGCLDSCEGNDDCAEEFRCEQGECVAESAECSEDDRYSISTDESGEQDRDDCFPYYCTAAGVCADSCKSSSECFEGYVCDPDSSKCVELTTSSSSSDSGGCGCSLPGSKTPGGALVAGLVALVLGAGRRRHSGSVRRKRPMQSPRAG